MFRVKGAFEVYEPGALGSQVEGCWAMTVHKAQGSEFDHVALVLGSPEALGEAVERSLERWSALSDPAKWVR